MFRSVKMRVENHIHIRHIMLYHFEKGHSAAEAFLISMSCLVKELLVKVASESGLYALNQAILHWKTRKEEAENQISTIKPFWMPWKKMKA